MRPRSSPEGTPTSQTRSRASYKHTWHLKLAQEGPIELQEGSKMTPGWLKTVSRCSKMASKLFQDASRQAHLGLRQAQDGSQQVTTWLKGPLLPTAKTHKNHWFSDSGTPGAAKRGQEAFLKALGHARHVQGLLQAHLAAQVGSRRPHRAPSRFQDDRRLA